MDKTLKALSIVRLGLKSENNMKLFEKGISEISKEIKEKIIEE